MFRELREWLHLILLYGFLYICALGVLVVFIVNAPKNSPEVIYHVTPAPEPIVQIVTTPRELEAVEICSRIDGCPIVEGVCETCQIVKR